MESLLKKWAPRISATEVTVNRRSRKETVETGFEYMLLSARVIYIQLRDRDQVHCILLNGRAPIYR